MTIRQNFQKNRHLTSPYRYRGPTCLRGRTLMSRAFARKHLYTQQFKLKGEFLINPAGMALDSSGGRDRENNGVIMWNKHGKSNQRWRIEYFGGKGAKKVRKTRMVGYTMNKYYGFY